MSKKQQHSFGAMETYEADDKSFTKHMLKEGTGDVTANEGSVCNVTIYTIDEKVDFAEGVLCDYKMNEECEVTIGEGDSVVAQLLDKAISTMKEGEISYVKTKVTAEGKRVSELDGGGKTGLKVKIQLRTLNRAAELSDLEPDEKLERGQHHKDKGTELFQKGNIDFALIRYKRALDYVKSMDNCDLPGDLPQRFTTLQTHCYLNLAAVYLKKEDYNLCVDSCTEALKIDPKNVKALYRRGQAYLKQHEYLESQKDLTLAKSIEPDNKAILSTLHTVQQSMKKEKQVYQKMFS